MRKTLLRGAVTLAMATAAIAMSAGSASADTKGGPLGVNTPGPTDEYPTLQDNWNSWNTGGAMLGEGAARLVSAAWDGAPQSVIANVKRIGAPYTFGPGDPAPFTHGLEGR